MTTTYGYDYSLTSTTTCTVPEGSEGGAGLWQWVVATEDGQTQSFTQHTVCRTGENYNQDGYGWYDENGEYHEGTYDEGQYGEGYDNDWGNYEAGDHAADMPAIAEDAAGEEERGGSVLGRPRAAHHHLRRAPHPGKQGEGRFLSRREGARDGAARRLDAKMLPPQRC